jgi:hypothetical protein
MGLIPQIAKLVPVQVRRFCEGLRYPHVFIILLPTFIIGLVFSSYLPYPEQILTGIGVAMFFTSKARWD